MLFCLVCIVLTSKAIWGHRGCNVFFTKTAPPPRDMGTEKYLKCFSSLFLMFYNIHLWKIWLIIFWANLAFFQKVAGPLLQRPVKLICNADLIKFSYTGARENHRLVCRKLLTAPSSLFNISLVFTSLSLEKLRKSSESYRNLQMLTTRGV